MSCLPASSRIFERLKNGIIALLKQIFTLKRSPRIFGAFFLAESFEKVSFDPYNFRITRFLARKSEQVKILNTKIRLTMLCLSGFEPYSRWVPLVCDSPL